MTIGGDDRRPGWMKGYLDKTSFLNPPYFKERNFGPVAGISLAILIVSLVIFFIMSSSLTLSTLLGRGWGYAAAIFGFIGLGSLVLGSLTKKSFGKRWTLGGLQENYKKH